MEDDAQNLSLVNRIRLQAMRNAPRRRLKMPSQISRRAAQEMVLLSLAYEDGDYLCDIQQAQR